MPGKIISYKGFDENFTCRGFKYEEGKEYKHEGEVEQCSSGFNACPAPLDTFGYYPPATSRYAIVEQSGHLSEGDDKVASSIIKIKAEINILDLVKAQVEWIKSKLNDDNKEHNTGNQSAATNTGYQSAATNTGNYSAATNTGYQSAATNTGYQSAATNTGYQSAASVNGNQSIAFVAGYDSKAKASEGSWIVITDRNDDGEIMCIKTAKAGVDVKPDTYYKVINGQFVEAE